MKPSVEDIAKFILAKTKERNTIKCPSCKNMMKQKDPYFKTIWYCNTPDCFVYTIVLNIRESSTFGKENL